MDLVNPRIDRYLAGLARSDDRVLAEMERLAEERSFPIVGPQVGRLLYVLARACAARRVLELGSGFGYSAWWFAHAVGPEGRVVLTEASTERATQARDFLGRAGLGERIRVEVGDALELARSRCDEFDVVFNDVDKESYPEVLPLAESRLRPGGLFVSDNMLWFGKVVEDGSTDAATRGVRELTRRLAESRRFATAWIPLRDGISMAVKL